MADTVQEFVRDWIGGADTSYAPKVATQFGDNTGNADAFGRLRISNPVTIFDSQLQYNDAPLIWESNGDGTAAHDQDLAGVQLSVASGETIIRQSRQYIRYQPGKSQLVFMTFVMGAAAANVTKRAGYYDANDGLFLELTSSALSFVRRTSTSAAVVDNSVAQADWNLDPMDGTGPSGITLDMSKSQILVIDMEWLGVGRARMGFVIDGVFYYTHQFLNANNLDVVYMKTANLPVRYEMVSTTGTASDFYQICSTVISEGGFQEDYGIPHATGNGSAGIASVQARRPVLSIQPVTTYAGTANRGNIVPESFSVYATTNSVYYEIVYGGTVAGASFGSVGANSIVQEDVAGTAITGGEVIYSGYTAAAGAPGQARATAAGGLASRLPLTTGVDGTIPLTLSIVATGIGGAATVHASITWKEYY